MVVTSYMKTYVSWFVAALMTLLVRECFAQTNVAVISSSPAVTNLQGAGINLYQRTFWDASDDYLQNILANPGFEPSNSGRVVAVPSNVTSTTFCDSNNWFAMPSGFYNGATFEDVYVTGSGSNAVAASRGTGTITAYNPTGCASSTPQFTYSASFTISAGDYIRFHAIGSLGNAGTSAYAPVGWWNSDAAITLVTDKQPTSDGAQALDFALNGSAHTINQYQDAPDASYTGTPSNWIQVKGSWTVSCWAKAVNAVSPSLTLSFGRIGSTTYFKQTVVPTSSWTQYSSTFTGSDSSLTSNVAELQFQLTGSGSSGDIRVDDCFVGPTAATTSPWSNDMVNALKSLNPGFIRDQQGAQGDSYANFVADDTARGPASFQGGAFTWLYNVDQFFKLNAAVGSTPWVIIPVVLTDSEYQALGSYFAKEEAIYNFPQIIIEWGNEMWNGGSCGGVCYSYQGDQYSAVAKRDFNSLLVGAGSNSGTYLKWAAGAQYGAYPPNPGQITGVESAASTATYIAGAPYYFFCLDTQVSLANDMSLLLGDQNLQLSYMSQITNAVASGGHQFATYEGGPSTWWGSASNTERNGTIAGAGSAAADAELALNLWTSGTAVVNFWNLAQTTFTCNGSGCASSPIGNVCTGTPPSPMSADMWGVAHDLPTGRLRPRGLALQLLNNYFITSNTGSYYPTSSNTYAGVTVGAWHDSHNLWNVAIVNSNSSPQNVIVQFPSTTGLPTGTVQQINYTSSIADTNENSALVTTGNGGAVITGPNSNQVTIPVPAYGLVVAQAAASDPTATPTPTASPTPVPTASPTPIPTASPTPVPTASPTPVPTASPTPVPTASPTPVPTASPTPVPTASPTPVPTASPTPAAVSITNPAANSSVSRTVVFGCTDSASSSTVNIYVDDVYVGGGSSPLSYTWNTTTASNGRHYLVCNGYVGHHVNGSVAENVTVHN